MKKWYLIVAFLFWFSANPDAFAGDLEIQEEINALLENQVQAWSEGDFERYMENIWRSDEFRYVSGTFVIHGWDQVLEIYTRYDTAAKRGLLSYSNIETTVLSEGVVLVFGNWAVLHPANPEADIEGTLSKVFKKIDGKWVAIHIHFSTEPKP